MKKNIFVHIVIGFHLIYIGLQIHKQSYVIKWSFEKQRNEKHKDALRAQKNNLTEQLFILKHRSTIKTFAQTTLHMKKIGIDQVKMVKPNE